MKISMSIADVMIKSLDHLKVLDVQPMKEMHTAFIINFEDKFSLLTRDEGTTINQHIDQCKIKQDVLLDTLGNPWFKSSIIKDAQDKLYGVSLFKTFCESLLRRSDNHLKQLKKKG